MDDPGQAVRMHAENLYRLSEIERRLALHEVKLDALGDKVSQFIGASRVLAFVLVISVVAQGILQFFHKV